MKKTPLERLSEAERLAKILRIEEALTRGNVTLCNDRFFRSIFGSKESEVFLTPFINAVQTSANEKPVVSVTIQNPFQPSKFWKEKEPILDVLAQDETGRLFDIEMQVCNQRNFRERVLYYMASIFSRQVKVGEDYEKLRPVVGIILVDFDIWPKEVQKILAQQGKRGVGVNFDTFKMTSVNNGLIFSEHIVIHFIRIPKKGEDASGYFRDPKLANWFKAFRSTTPANDPELDEAEKSTPGLKDMRKMMISFLSTNAGEKYLKGLHRRDSWGDLKFNQGWEGGETSEAYDNLVFLLRRLFKKNSSEIESIFKGLDVQELRRLRNIAFDCASYEEFAGIVKAEEHELATSR